MELEFVGENSNSTIFVIPGRQYQGWQAAIVFQRNLMANLLQIHPASAMLNVTRRFIERSSFKWIFKII
ncbi:hypothetical protein AN404_04650 [Pediococcus acidilactici]|nr:hypothetical protein AN404_04650 [Pediococcus acidilactici]